MNKDITLGKINKLKISRASEYGLYLSAKNNQEVLLPNRYVTSFMSIGDIIDVFIYNDSEDRLVATTETPYAMVGEFYNFEVVDITKIGTFVNWGLTKDLFVPKSFQKSSLKVGQKVILRVTVDEKTNRLIGSSKIGQFLDKKVKRLIKNQEVKLLVLAKTPLGYKVIVDDRYEGVIYRNEIFEDIKVGDIKKGFIKSIREDYKLDISLQPIGKKRDELAIKKIVAKLKEHDGELEYNSKSDLHDIQKVFGLSKKSFKKALNQLKSDGIIEENGLQSGIRLVSLN